MIQIIKKITTATIACIFMLSACDLDRYPESQLSDAVYWNSDGEFKEALNYLYKVSDINVDDEQFPLVGDVMSDNMVINTGSKFAAGTYQPEGKFQPWDRDYIIIRTANNILEKSDNINFDSEKMPAYQAEARFFRAWAYADLVRRFGGVPLIMTTLDTDSEDLYSARSSVEVVMDAIYSDLDFAILNLNPNSKTSYYSRATIGAARALKSRAALRQGTWNKFHNEGDANKHLQIAKKAALDVMQSDEYDLFFKFATDSSYTQLFKLAGEGDENREAIWAWEYGIQEGGPILRKNNFPALVSQGWYGASKSLVDSYLCIDGLPIDQSPLYLGRVDVTSEFVDRDPRLNGTILKKGDIYRQNVGYIPNLISMTGYTITKHYDNIGISSITYFMDLMTLRYGEVLLNYAEATFELDDAISDADLDMSINLLRDRVAMPHLTNTFATTNGLDMQEEIRRERRVELAIEGFRYDDLLRWKTAEIELPNAILGVRLFAAEYPGVDPSSVNLISVDGVDSIVVVETDANRSFDPSKNYLWPLPLNEMGLNPNLEQNPGWN